MLAPVIRLCGFGAPVSLQSHAFGLVKRSRRRQVAVVGMRRITRRRTRAVIVHPSIRPFHYDRVEVHFLFFWCSFFTCAWRSLGFLCLTCDTDKKDVLFQGLGTVQHVVDRSLFVFREECLDKLFRELQLLMDVKGTKSSFAVEGVISIPQFKSLASSRGED